MKYRRKSSYAERNSVFQEDKQTRYNRVSSREFVVMTETIAYQLFCSFLFLFVFLCCFIERKYILKYRVLLNIVLCTGTLNYLHVVFT